MNKCCRLFVVMIYLLDYRVRFILRDLNINVNNIKLEKNVIMIY